MRTRREQIMNLAQKIGAETFPPGDRAALRRMDPDAPSAVMWRVLAQVDPELLDALGGGDVSPWAEVLQLLATLGGLARPSGLSAGAALGAAGVSEVRLERLLRSAQGQLRPLAHQLASAGVAVDPSDLALLLVGAPDLLEGVRMKIARDYYRTTRTSSKETA